MGEEFLLVDIVGLATFRSFTVRVHNVVQPHRIPNRWISIVRDDNATAGMAGLSIGSVASMLLVACSCCWQHWDFDALAHDITIHNKTRPSWTLLAEGLSLATPFPVHAVLTVEPVRTSYGVLCFMCFLISVNFLWCCTTMRRASSWLLWLLGVLLLLRENTGVESHALYQRCRHEGASSYLEELRTAPCQLCTSSGEAIDSSLHHGPPVYVVADPTTWEASQAIVAHLLADHVPVVLLTIGLEHVLPQLAASFPCGTQSQAHALLTTLALPWTADCDWDCQLQELPLRLSTLLPHVSQASVWIDRSDAAASWLLTERLGVPFLGWTTTQQPPPSVWNTIRLQYGLWPSDEPSLQRTVVPLPTNDDMAPPCRPCQPTLPPHTRPVVLVVGNDGTRMRQVVQAISYVPYDWDVVRIPGTYNDSPWPDFARYHHDTWWDVVASEDNDVVLMVRLDDDNHAWERLGLPVLRVLKDQVPPARVLARDMARLVQSNTSFNATQADGARRILAQIHAARQTRGVHWKEQLLGPSQYEPTRLERVLAWVAVFILLVSGVLGAQGHPELGQVAAWGKEWFRRECRPAAAPSIPKAAASTKRKTTKAKKH